MVERNAPSAYVPITTSRPRWQSSLAVLLAAASVVLLSTKLYQPANVAPLNSKPLISECQLLTAKPGAPPDFHKRKVSDRFEKGTKATLIRNATIWTGGQMGNEVIHGDILLDGGIIRAFGHISEELIESYSPSSLNSVNAQGAWVTPGLFDLHSHAGIMAAPLLRGAFDLNSPNGPVTPWARTIDALNTRDDSYRLTVAGGVTGALILPGSGHAIGGQAFPVKYRRTSERSPSSMLIEPLFVSNALHEIDPSQPLRWRHIKHATGENSIDFGTRMDSTWFIREAYDKARQIKRAQDSFCTKIEKGLWNDPEVKGKEFPFELQWEALVDVLRGRAKAHFHTYESEDIDFLSRLSNEFEFHIAALHHAHEAYLVPDVLKRMHGGPPAAALFALNGRYKRESYRASEFAPRILADSGIDVVLKTDHPVINSRHLIFEAQQAHFYSLKANLALRSVITTPAEIAGLGHRLGRISKGFDADIVIWDSHPLVLGATPKQVYIDGIPQLDNPYTLDKPKSFQTVPRPPDWEREVKETLDWDGLPSLRPRKRVSSVTFLNVNSVWRRKGTKIVDSLHANGIASGSEPRNVTVVVSEGRVRCIGKAGTCGGKGFSGGEIVDLDGGAISLGLTTFGSPLGLSEIDQEPSTTEEGRFRPLSEIPPPIIRDSTFAIEAGDGLSFDGRDTLYAYRFGVTTAISSWDFVRENFWGGGTFQGTSVAFRTGALHGLEDGGIVKATTALHVAIKHGLGLLDEQSSIGTQIAALRNALQGDFKSKSWHMFHQVRRGKIPLVIDVDSADIMVSLIRLKKEMERWGEAPIRVVFHGAQESHLIAKEIAAAGISVILNPVHPYPRFWDSRRILPGAPLTKQTSITALMAHGVTVAVGVKNNWEARNAMFNVAQAFLEADGVLTKQEALALASTNLNRIFGITNKDASMDDLVAYRGGDIFDLESKVVGIISPRLRKVDLF